MTKKVRIENADTSSHKVHVFLENKAPDGTWVREGEVPAAQLDYPTFMTEQYIHSTRRLVVEEA